MTNKVSLKTPSYKVLAVYLPQGYCCLTSRRLLSSLQPCFKTIAGEALLQTKVYNVVDYSYHDSKF